MNTQKIYPITIHEKLVTRRQHSKPGRRTTTNLRTSDQRRIQLPGESRRKDVYPNKFQDMSLLWEKKQRKRELLRLLRLQHRPSRIGLGKNKIAKVV